MRADAQSTLERRPGAGSESLGAPACVRRQLLEDLAGDLRLTFGCIAARSRPCPVVRRLAVALTAACRRIEREAPFAATTVVAPLPSKRRSGQGKHPSRPSSRRTPAPASSPP